MVRRQEARHVIRWASIRNQSPCVGHAATAALQKALAVTQLSDVDLATIQQDMKGSTAQLTLFVAGAFLTVTIVVLYSTQSHILGGTTRQFRIKSPSSLEKAVVPSASPWSESGGDAFRNTRDHWHMYTGLSADNHTTRAAAGELLTLSLFHQYVLSM